MKRVIGLLTAALILVGVVLGSAGAMSVAGWPNEPRPKSIGIGI